MTHHRGVEQLVARQAHNLKVTGSNPVSATNCGRIAQMVEQRTENPRVPSSILGLTTIFLFYIRLSEEWEYSLL